jgi:hypothetical protein
MEENESKFTLDDEHRMMHDSMATWGYDAQLLMLVEEFSELMIELCHDRRTLKVAEPNNVISELWDADFMLREFKRFYQDLYGKDWFDKTMTEIREAKLTRLKERLSKHVKL